MSRSAISRKRWRLRLARGIEREITWHEDHGVGDALLARIYRKMLRRLRRAAA